MKLLVPTRTSGTFLSPYIEQYVAAKRALGTRYNSVVYDLGLWDQFISAHGVTAWTQIDHALTQRFLDSRPRRSAKSFNVLLSTSRSFFAYLARHGLVVRNPVDVPKRQLRDIRQPYIFNAEQIQRLLQAAKVLPTQGSSRNRGQVCYVIFALLYGVGLRVGEVCRLTMADVDLQRRALLIRETKFDKTRWVPLGPNLYRLLSDYLVSRKHMVAADLSDEIPLFSFTQGKPVTRSTIGKIFRNLVRQLALKVQPGCAQPRLHDLRHSFAVGRLVRWYRQGMNVSSRLCALSTFMGHVDPSSTQVYLTITEELLSEAGKRFESFATQPAYLQEGIQ
jgi:site-specific recombinase XerD